MGIASLVLSIVALILSFFGVFMFWPALILSVAGIVLGAIGKSKKSSCATAGLVISIIAAAIVLIWFVACSAALA